MSKFFLSMAFKLGLAIFLIASVLLSSLEIFYARRFSREIDERLARESGIPARLMGQQALSYAMARDTGALSGIVGEEVVFAAACQSDGTVYYCSDPALEGRPLPESYNFV